ncbi:MAG TPA: hypothetical protein VLG27_03680 [Candidatus Saccharimonadia bacterium]|nr:hypothetical protein [Candidatus Saccharimonadia bacterium]
MQTHRILVGIPLVAVTIFCFSYVMADGNHSSYGNTADNKSKSAYHKTETDNLPAIPFTQLQKLSLMPTSSAGSSAAQGSPGTPSSIPSDTPVVVSQGQAPDDSGNSLQSAPANQAKPALLGIPLKLPKLLNVK